MPQILRDNCKKCGVKLDPSNCVRTKSGRLNTCKECYNRYKRPVNKKNYAVTGKEWHQQYHLKRRYGLDELQIKHKLAIQLNGCAICKLPFNEERKMAVDHDHKTGAIRDLLCYKCNGVLGLLNDSEDRIWDVLEYLKRHAKSKSA